MTRLEQPLLAMLMLLGFAVLLWGIGTVAYEDGRRTANRLRSESLKENEILRRRLEERTAALESARQELDARALQILDVLGDNQKWKALAERVMKERDAGRKDATFCAEK